MKHYVATWAVFVAAIGMMVGCAGQGETGDVAHLGSLQGDESFRTLKAGAETATITCLSPVNYTVFQSLGVTTPVNVTFETNVADDLAAGTIAVTWYDNGPPLLGTQKTTEAIGFNLNYGEHQLTLQLVDDKGVPMTGDSARCSVRVRVTRSCLSDLDCIDNFFCNVNTCKSNADGSSECAFGPAPFDGCCQQNFECSSNQYCDKDGKTCEQCTADDVCDDGNACTTDSCVDGGCLNIKTDPLCCDCTSAAAGGVNDQCADGLFCTNDSCNCETGQCENTPKTLSGTTCCETQDSASCADDDPCTEDTCANNVCQNVVPAKSNCCVKDADCGDGNVCTVDSCDTDNTVCVYEPVSEPGCCNTDDECDDNNPKTLDACTNFECVHTENVDYCEPPVTSDLVINELMVNPSAVGDALGEWIELHNQSGAPINVQGWTLTESGASAVQVVISPDAALSVPAGGYVVLCRNGDVSTNGGVACDWTYGDSYELANDGDSVILMNADGAKHDEVVFDGGPNFPSPDGASMALINPVQDNNVGGNWKISTETIAGGTDLGTAGAQNTDIFEVFEVAQCHETPLDNPCTIDTCINNTCAHIPVEGCCNKLSDCEPPSPCHVAQCTDNTCSYSEIPAPGCCSSDAVCDDGIPCTVDKCLGYSCRHGPDPSELGKTCCNVDSDCGGLQNDCVSSQCNVQTHTCTSPELLSGAGCCTENTYPKAAPASECDDNDVATVDTCKDYNCLSFPDPNYCEVQPGVAGINNCDLDNDPCTNNACNVAAKTCLHAKVFGCCHSDNDCDDNNACTVDSCGPGNTCVNTPDPVCCTSATAAQDCNDNNPCTLDECVNPTPSASDPAVLVGFCRSQKTDPTCCVVDSECEDGNVCTVGTCNAGNNTCTFAAVPDVGGKKCCDPDSQKTAVETQCDDGDLCTVDSCVNNQCVYSPEPTSQFGKCCDLGNAQNLTGAQLCDDGQACTLDVCQFGRCRHVSNVAEDCCQVDADCDDLNACTDDVCSKEGSNTECINLPKECDDGLYCNGAETCNIALGCTTVPGTAPVVSDGLDCTVDSCDETSKSIVHTPDNASCDDNQYCNGAEVCDLALGCIAGVPISLEDGNDCTIDTCNNALKKVLHTPNDGLCDDGKDCSGVETCDVELGCQPGAGFQVDDGIDCTLDTCDDTTGELFNIPKDENCDDGLFCTVNTCDAKVGCKTSLSPGFCIIDSVCYTDQSLNPANSCQTCDSKTNPQGWSAKSFQPEVCNGMDDDCDGLTDEDDVGDALVQSCKNNCGQLGIEVCKSGTFIDCTAQDVDEICNNNVDDDCDNKTDESPCEEDKPVSDKADVSFITTVGEVENVVEALGDGKYSTYVRGLANPNKSGSVAAKAYSAQSAMANFSVTALPPAAVEVINLRPVLYKDANESTFVFQVRDIFERPVATGTVVTLSYKGLELTGGPENTVTCTTDTQGRCKASWTAPVSAFLLGGDVLVEITAGSYPTITRKVTLKAAPQTLKLNSPGVGLQLPVSPQFPGKTFKVPLYLSTGGSQAGGYQVTLKFDPDALKATSVQAGDCGAFDQPVNNLASNANVKGELNLNQLDALGINPCGAGNQVHVATITFKVLSGATANGSSGPTLTGKVVSLVNQSFGQLAGDEPCQFADINGVSTTGKVLVWAPEVVGILARSGTAQLLNWQPVTGNNATTQVLVTAYKRDLSEAFVTFDPATTFNSSNAQVAAINKNGLVTPGTQPGVVILTATHGSFASTARVRVLQPKPLEMTLSDPVLSPITGTGAGGASVVYQHAKVTVLTTWTDGVVDQWTQDITGLFKNTNFDVPPGMIYDKAQKALLAQTGGSYPVKLLGPAGKVLAQSSVNVVPASAVQCQALGVVSPCQILMEKVSPEAPTAQLGYVKGVAGVYGYMTSYQQKCQAQVYAHFSDGTRKKVTGASGLTMTSQTPTIASVTPGGLMTALSSGQTVLNAKWVVGGTTVCSGSGIVGVKLPEPTGMIVTPLASQIAVSDTDPAATVKGLPTTQKLTVKVIYADGATQDFTNNPSTSYDATSLDPQDFIMASTGGIVSAAGEKTGTGKVRVTIDLYPQLEAIAQVEVVKAESIFPAIYEPFTPTLPRVPDNSFTYIEGTNTLQDGTFEVLITFSDGSTVDITDSSKTKIEVYKAGGNVPTASVVKLDKSKRTITALDFGVVDIWFIHDTMVQSINSFSVTGGNASVFDLHVSMKGGATFSGIKGKGTSTVETWAKFNDFTRRRLYGDRLVAGLLTFKSTVPQAATVDSKGNALIQGNKSTVFQVDVSSAVDVVTPYDPPAEFAVDCNLLPDCGDVDFGDEVGLAYKDQAPGAQFTLEVRTNTCGQPLGGLDLEIHYDPLVLDAFSADAHGATVGAIFTPNPFGQAGVVTMNAAFNPLGGEKIGNNLAIALVHFKTLKSEKQISAMGGVIKSMLNLDGNPIGQAIPLEGIPMIAAVGDLDPACPTDDVLGDTNGDCIVSQADVSLVMAALAGELPHESAMDVDRNGVVDISDALRCLREMP